MMNTNEMKSFIMQELPHIIQTDQDIRRFIVDLGQKHFADRTESDRRFDRIMDELAEQRRQSDIKWEEHLKSEQEYRTEQQKKWDEQQKKWDEQQKKWDENQKKWDENQKKWDEQQKERIDLMNEIKDMRTKHESSIGALGARWGLCSEESFRNGLKGILEKNFGVEVININEYDDEGYVFGRPDQVELDIIIKDGILIICELKSSVSKSDMYTFERKARFYEKRHNRKASGMMVISPMVDDRARDVAVKLNIEVYTHAYDVKPSP